MNTPSYKHISDAICALIGVVTKEEGIQPVEKIGSGGGNISDSTTNADTDKPSPGLILSTNTSCPISKEEPFLKTIQMIKSY